MAIFSGDIKLNASQVMLDVPEGGGGPTATVIPDGVSNAVFPDVSELDRVNGRVNLRQLHVTVQTNDTATYLGANVIVADPPQDPNVSITLFSTGNPFDVRAQAVSRMEAYLNVGATYQGYLFGNHIEGQSTLLILQRSDTVLAVGETLVLTKREGYGDEFVQYVRVTESSLVPMTFTDAQGDFFRNLMTVKLSDTLRQDFLGFDATRYEIGADAIRLRTKLSGTVVANSGSYYGVVPLVVDANIGDFTIKAQSVFTQLVPSAQVETPIADVRTNQTAVVVVPAGASVVKQVPSLTLNSTVAIHVGSIVTPNTLVVTQTGSGLAIGSDDGAGRFIHTSNVVFGTIDYETGVLQFNTSASGTAALDITYVPGAVMTPINQSQGFEVTQSNRALNYIRTIEPPPVPGSTTVSYRAQDKWYVLRDDGTGALRGSDTSIGAGTVNSTTGTVSVTLGALPDVDTSLIYQWVQPATERAASEIKIGDGNFYIGFNADGDLVDTPATKGFTPGALNISWLDGATTRTVTDSGLNGQLTGYATGTIDYADGVVRMQPTTLPPVGTALSVGYTAYGFAGYSSAPVVLSGDDLIFNVGANVPVGTLVLSMTGTTHFRYDGGTLAPFNGSVPITVRDNAAGQLVYSVGSAYASGSASTVIGSINHATGDCVLNGKPTLNAATAAVLARFENLFEMRYSLYAPVGMRSS